MDLNIYRKPTNNNRFLSFFSGHAHQVRIGLMISLIDRIFRISTPNFIVKELLLLKKLKNQYPGRLIDQIFSKKRTQFLEFSNDILETTEKKDIFCFFTICSRAE